MFLGFGIPDLFLLALLGVVISVPVGILVFVVSVRRRARQFGYPSMGEYLRAAPRSDAEKRDAADLALKGLVFCVLGVLMAPFVLIGLVPLFYGGRKLLFAWMGLGLVDDAGELGA